MSTDDFGRPGISTSSTMQRNSSNASVHRRLPRSLSSQPPDLPRIGNRNFLSHGHSRFTPAGFIMSRSRWMIHPAVIDGANGRNNAASSSECDTPLCLSSLGMIGTCRPIRLLDLSMSGSTEPMMMPAATASSEPGWMLSVVQIAAAQTPDAKCVEPFTSLNHLKLTAGNPAYHCGYLPDITHLLPCEGASQLLCPQLQ